jgi:dienelactone hydrolase
MRASRPIGKWFDHWLLSSLLLAACSAPQGPVAIMQAPGGTAAVDVRAVPWPSDALLGADGHLVVGYPLPFDAANTENLMQLAATLSEQDGFGVTSSIFFPVDAGGKNATVVVDTGASATVVDLADPTRTWSYPLLWRAETNQLVALAPVGAALREQHTYGCFVTGGVHDGAGHPLRPAAAMSDAIAGRGVFGQKASYLALAALLAQQKVKPLAATAFTTRSLTSWTKKVLSDLAAAPPRAHVTRTFSTAQDLTDLFGGPVTTTRPGRPPSGGVIHDAVALVVEGTFDVPHYLSATPGTLGLFDAAETVKATDHVPFLIALPKRASYAGTPVIVFQHGIDNDRSAVLVVANDFAARGYAVLGIDELFHGSRRPGAVDLVNNLSGAAIPDGIGDPASFGAVQYFFDFNGDPASGSPPLDPRYMRDNFRQATVDLMQLVRFAKQGDVSEIAAADPSLAALTLDGSRLVYTGESFGSILGSQLMALDPLAGAAVLDVGGGGLMPDLISHSPSFASLLEPFVSGAYDVAVDLQNPDTAPTHGQMSLELLQTVIEPGDGLALAPEGDPAKQILFLDDFSDEVVPNQAEEALASAWNASQMALAHGSHAASTVTFPQVAAPYSAAPLRAIVILDPATHAMYTAQQGMRSWVPGFPPFMKQQPPIMITNPVETAHALALSFIDSYRASGAATVSDPTK